MEFIEGGLSVEKYAAFGGRATIKDIIGMPLESKTQLLHFFKSVMRTDHIMVTVNNGKFVSIMFEKH